MPPINVISSIIVVLGFILVLRAFAPLLSRVHLGDFGFYMIRAAIGVALVTILRSLYWDISQFALGENWAFVRDLLGGQRASTVFNALLAWPIIDFCKARLAAIPDDERHLWRWYTAWAHPGDRCIINWRRRG